MIHDSYWFNFIHFSGYKYKIRLVSRIRKREDQALIVLSTIQKFPAQATFVFFIYTPAVSIVGMAVETEELYCVFQDLLYTEYSTQNEIWERTVRFLNLIFSHSWCLTSARLFTKWFKNYWKRIIKSRHISNPQSLYKYKEFYVVSII